MDCLFVSWSWIKNWNNTKLSIGTKNPFQINGGDKDGAKMTCVSCNVCIYVETPIFTLYSIQLIPILINKQEFS